MAIKRKASGAAAGASPRKRVTRLHPSPTSDSDAPSPQPSPTRNKTVVQRVTAPATPRGRTASPRKRRQIIEEAPPASPNKLPVFLPIIPSQSCLNAQKRDILRAIQNPPDLDDGEEESANCIALKQLSDLLRGTVERGEGNSCLLLGPRGSGKSRILNRCISDLRDQPIVLQLCGWSQQSDRLAMREIAYQLSRQTGKSFLAVDEEPEMDPADDEPNPFIEPPNPVTMSLPPSTHLPALISMLPTLSRPTLIVLDAFDLFAQHPRQSLLYCLLDTVQSCRAGAGRRGIAVIGMSTRVDTVNLLEKRVKSRFSGRTLRTAPPSQSQDWVELARGILCSEYKDHRESGDADWPAQWKNGVESFLRDEATISVFRETFSVTKDVRVLARLLTSVATQLSPSSPFPTSAHLVSAAASQRSRPQFSYLHALPYPSICLLIACVHAETAGHPAFTFEMLHEKVRDQIRLSTSAPVEFNGTSIGMPRCPRSVLMSAFESLVSAKIFAPTAAPSASVAKEFIKFRAVVSREDVKKAIQTRNDINLNKWLTKAT